ncbi:MAG: dTDP-4-dehydrorhamnose 3,5-epimerase [Nevskia sp.]|nr:dTDP-4-dehydrorhamnose 3,5-epimerase [Nevskia sp.]
MKFVETPIQGVFVLELELMADERGFFARTFCSHEFARNGLNPQLLQCSISYNARAGTLRGMHFQQQPYAEAKLVRCIRGAIYDVVLDLRKESQSFKKWFSVELTSGNRSMLYVPEGCAHGFQTLVDDSEVMYQMSSPHVPEATIGVRWDDPAFAIVWPKVDRRTLSVRDAAYGDFR